MTQGARYVNFMADGMTLINEFFEKDVQINPDVVQAYTTITLKNVNVFNHFIDSFIMPQKQIERTSRVFNTLQKDFEKAYVAGDMKKLTEIKGKI